MARQATAGADGKFRFSMQIPIRIGRAEILAAITYFRSKDDDLLPVSRTDAKRLARDLLAKFGSEGVNGISSDDTSRERLREINLQTDELFPELRDRSTQR